MTSLELIEERKFAASWLREVGQLRPNNHDLWQYLQRRVRDPAPMATIAAELGLDVDALCAWMLAYTGPRHRAKQVRDTTSYGPPVGITPVEDEDGEFRTSKDAQRFANWRRATAAAAKARRGGTE